MTEETGVLLRTTKREDSGDPQISDGGRREQILFCVGNILKNRPDYRTIIQFRAVAAGCESLFVYAFADSAIRAAIGEFRALRAAAHAIYRCGGNLRRIVHDAPLPGRFFS